MTDDRVESGGGFDGTSSSFLDRIREKDEEGWRQFVSLYRPLVVSWCRRAGLQDADLADVVQEVFRTVAQAIAGYHHERAGDSFRGWLRSVTRSRIVDFHRQRGRAAIGIGGSDAEAQWLQLPASGAGPDSSVPDTDEDDRRILIRRAVDLVLAGCKEESRAAFLRVVVDEQAPADVARDLGISVNAVYLAKSHILRKIREAFSELIDLRPGGA